MSATRILIAEDETIIRLDLRGILERQGFEVCAEARDGLEAVDLARETEPDLILMDVMMPNLDGVSALRRILADARAGKKRPPRHHGDGACRRVRPRATAQGGRLGLRAQAGGGRGPQGRDRARHRKPGLKSLHPGSRAAR